MCLPPPALFIEIEKTDDLGGAMLEPQPAQPPPRYQELQGEVRDRLERHL